MATLRYAAGWKTCPTPPLGPPVDGGGEARLGIVEADAAFFGRAGRRRHQLPDGLEDDLEVLVVLAEFLFHFFEFGGKVFVGREDFAQADESPHDRDVHLDGPGAVEDGR